MWSAFTNFSPTSSWSTKARTFCASNTGLISLCNSMIPSRTGWSTAYTSLNLCVCPPVAHLDTLSRDAFDHPVILIVGQIAHVRLRQTAVHHHEQGQFDLSRHFPDSLLFNNPAPTEIYTLSLHDALPI